MKNASSYQSKLDIIRWLELNLHQKDFLLTWDRSGSEIQSLLLITELLKQFHQEGRSFRTFDTGLAISIFRDNSTRTRFSFASALNAVGLGLAELDEVKSQIAHGETVRETANMISFLTEVVGIRDDMFLGEGHTYMKEFGEAVQDGFDQGVLHRRPSVINLQCDIDHPTQSLADLSHLRNTFGSLEALRGKKIAMSWAYSPSYGKPLSVPQGIIGLLSRFGMNVTLAYPEGYDLIPDVVSLAERQSSESGGSFTVTHSMEDAFRDADIVYPKSWAPFHVMEQRTALLKNSDKAGLVELEHQCLDHNAKFMDWECDARKMKLTNNALYMHCLPADISGVSCKNGEVSKEVFEAARIPTYREASYKPFVIAAMILMTRFEKPAEVLDRILNRCE